MKNQKMPDLVNDDLGCFFLLFFFQDPLLQVMSTVTDEQMSHIRRQSI